VSWLVVCYLGAAVCANLCVAAFGPSILWLTALVMIPLDLTLRDALHERWRSRLWSRMAALIAGGSLLTLVVNTAAWPVAVASCAAFAVAGTVDALVYQRTPGTKLVRVNASNAAGALCDSVVFQVVAWGALDVSVVASQTAIKVIGSILCSLLLIRKVAP
jgi:uncharacterized PurR-regulated membrane protein YhhQ (DUF165 family)